MRLIYKNCVSQILNVNPISKTTLNIVTTIDPTTLKFYEGSSDESPVKVKFPGGMCQVNYLKTI